MFAEDFVLSNLGETIGRLAAERAAVLLRSIPGTGPDRLHDMDDFGSNPGGLRGRSFVPKWLKDNAPLVVVLHGCTQNAADYDRGSGWSALAEEQGFALLFPEQPRANNANTCFNWFVPADIGRDGGEVLSIRQMTEAMVVTHGLDRRRIFVTGLSAGGAMAMAMLATCPDVFAGGAVIAGVPYAAAGNVAEALDRMRGQGIDDTAALMARVKAASLHDGPWPTLSVWHGSADHTVNPANAEAIIAVWCAVQGIDRAPALRQTVQGHKRRVWRDAKGDDIIEAWAIAGMAHGTPLATNGPEGLGVAGPHMVETGISSTRRIAAFWGIAAAAPATRTKPAEAAEPASGIESIITKALRQAGLVR